jgi:hypothetical protein
MLEALILGVWKDVLKRPQASTNSSKSLFLREIKHPNTI